MTHSVRAFPGRGRSQRVRTRACPPEQGAQYRASPRRAGSLWPRGRQHRATAGIRGKVPGHPAGIPDHRARLGLRQLQRLSLLAVSGSR